MLWRDRASADAGDAAFASTDIAAGFAAIIDDSYNSYLGSFAPLS